MMSLEASKKNKLWATEMMGKRLVCQEEKLKIPSFRKEDEECLAGVSVQVQA